MSDLTHFNDSGRARMVDVGHKAETERIAKAESIVRVNPETFQIIKTGGGKKGDVLGTAQIAGIMAAKKTGDIIPMCHPIMITGVDIEFQLDEKECTVAVISTVKCKGSTGVEMEALTAAATAALTIYDMCKAVQRDMVIERVRLLYKKGGKSGEFTVE